MNGYKNAETYYTSLWLENDESTYHYLIGKKLDMVMDTDEFAVYLKNKLEEYVYDALDNVQNNVIKGLMTDLIELSFEKIDFVQVAESLIGE